MSNQNINIGNISSGGDTKVNIKQKSVVKNSREKEDLLAALEEIKKIVAEAPRDQLSQYQKTTHANAIDALQEQVKSESPDPEFFDDAMHAIDGAIGKFEGVVKLIDRARKVFLLFLGGV